MKYLYFVLLILLGCSTTTEIVDKQIDLPGGKNKFNNVLNSIVALTEKDENGELEIPNCTGFFISETDIITAAHCVVEHKTEVFFTLGGFKQEVVFKDAKEALGKNIIFVTREQYDNWIRTRILDESPQHSSAKVISILSVEYEDLALLRINKGVLKSKYFLKIRDWNKETVTLGETVFSLGNPEGCMWILTKGIVSAVQHDLRNNYSVFHDARIGGGASGSPLLDINGNVIGVNNLYIGDENVISIAIPSFKIKHLQ